MPTYRATVKFRGDRLPICTIARIQNDEVKEQIAALEQPYSDTQEMLSAFGYNLMGVEPSVEYWYLQAT